ncbi:hypothetical protein OS493_036473 [Desmophyllum pertusum]|uniref:Uncharacterized protein n=1 Tax=Desmophyllum pertusum TaxID=174260 RepID=A0A9W9Y8U0_9CNID|nr:hypothetical protein OS493_036473 [Desmophyllum pertusum]
MSGQRNESRNQVHTATHQRYVSRLAWVFLEDLLKTDDIPCSLSDIEDHFQIRASSARGLHQGAGGINVQVHVENRRIRNHILQQGSENNTARTSTNIPSEGDD